MRLDLPQHVPDRLANRHPTPVGNVVQLSHYRIEKRGGCSQQPLPLNLGYVRASREVDAAMREVDKLLDVVSQRLGRTF